MTKLEKIEKQVIELDDADRRKLLAWLTELDEQAWDQQIAEDVKAGRLDGIAAEVLADHRAGRTRPL
jgi:hypothetical protein